MIGALTVKSFSFTARPWELEIKKSIDFFDFFAYPVSFFVKQGEILRVSSFNMQFWISDSIRFFFTKSDAKSVFANSFPIYVSVKTQYNVSWFELALFISYSLFQIDFCFFTSDTCFFKNSVNMQVGSLLNFVSADSFVDLTDRFQIYLFFKSIVSKSVFFKTQQISQFFFSPFNFSQVTSLEKSMFPYFIDKNKNFCFVFIFGSNLRYESPVLNSKVRSFYTANPIQFRVYQFGKNFSYFFNYPVLYGGGFSELIKLFSGRAKFLSKLIFSRNSFSIFGSNFFTDYFSNIFINFYSRLKQNIQFSIFLQSDFSKYAKTLFEIQPNSGTSIGFKPVLSVFSCFFFRSNTFLFNSTHRFRFTNSSNFLGSSDFNFFLQQNFFSFKDYFDFTKNGTSVFNFVKGSNNYIIPSYNFLVNSSNYLSLSNKVLKISKISKFLSSLRRHDQFSILLYLFKTVFCVYRSYRELYFTFFRFDISNLKNVKYNFSFRFNGILIKFLMFKAIKKDLNLKLPFVFQSYTSMFNFLTRPSFAKIYFSFANIYKGFYLL